MTAPIAHCQRDTGVLRISGEDRLNFLHRLLTADVATLGRGTSRQCLLLDTKGRVQALMKMTATGDAIVSFANKRAIETVVTTLQRYVLGADVAFEVSEAAVVGLRGPKLDDLISRTELPDDSVVACDGDLAQIACPAPEAVRDGLVAAGAAEVDGEAWRVARVMACEPAHDAEITGAEFPQELGLVDAVDFEKGCYLGQETVARIHYRGQVNRLLATVRADHRLDVGGDLLDGDSPVGRISSAAGMSSGGSIALALLSRAAAAPGAVLVDETGGQVEVVANVETRSGTTNGPSDP
ncbi:MAG: hypothetical protein GKS06_01550 [Acidobacteria bacterium]|nr:hypothetical protein [Acidobacteriota bacterium]